jgi:tRNA 2-thiouridine synthesizing protein A
MSERATMTAAAVVREVDLRWDEPCAACGVGLLGHDVVLSLVLGFRAAPRCATCLASAHGRPTDEFLRSAAANVRRLACYRAGWEHADRRLEASGSWPEDRIPASLRLFGVADAEPPERDPPRRTSIPLTCAAEFDAGDRGCGELALELRMRIEALAGGDVLRLIARDAGAPEDLPAWCRMTGHRLRGAEHPVYWIERKPL